MRVDLFVECYQKDSGIALFHEGLRALTLTLAVTLCGCAVAPLPRTLLTPVDVPSAWSPAHPAARDATTSLARWWLRFDDALLSSLINDALATNTSIQSAQAALQQARAARDGAQAKLGPTLGGSASAQRSRNGDTSGSSFRVGLDAGWELDFFGANRSGLNAAQATAQASAASLGDVQVSIAAEVALGYVALRSAQQRLAIAQANLALQRETQQLTQWRYQAGLVTLLEAEQSRAAAEQTSAQVSVLQTVVAQTRHALAVLTGRPPTALADLLAAGGPVPLASPSVALAIPAETLRQRSDVRAAEYQVLAAHARVAQADAQRLPGFHLNGSLGLNAASLSALTNGAALAASLLAQVALPLFDGGAGLAQVHAQQAALVQADAAYRATLLTALTEVEDALIALHNDQTRLLNLQHAADAAATAAQLAGQRFSTGLVDFQTVLETQRTRLGAQDAVAVAGAAISADQIRLYKALGGGWTPLVD